MGQCAASKEVGRTVSSVQGLTILKLLPRLTLGSGREERLRNCAFAAFLFFLSSAPCLRSGGTSWSAASVMKTGVGRKGRTDVCFEGRGRCELWVEDELERTEDERAEEVRKTGRDWPKTKGEAAEEEGRDTELALGTEAAEI